MNNVPEILHIILEQTNQIQSPNGLINDIAIAVTPWVRIWNPVGGHPKHNKPDPGTRMSEK